MQVQITVGELAAKLGGKVEGSEGLALTGVAPLETATKSDLSFVESERTLVAAAESQAGGLLAALDLVLPGRNVIRVRRPRRAMAQAIEIFHPRPGVKTGIHPTVVVGEGCRIGNEVSIGAHAVIGDGVSVGDRTRIGAGCVIGDRSAIGVDCVLHAGVTLYPDSRLGDRVILHSGAVIGADGFGYVFDEGRHWKFPQVGWVELGDDVEIGANSTIDRGALGATRIGMDTKIDNLVQVAHNVQIGEHCAIASQTGISGSAVIGDYVIIAGQVGIGDHARVDNGAILGGQCGILPHKRAKAGQPLWGTPARPLREILVQQATLARLAKSKRHAE
jgi:UDP-3-O-[3-hydroxymyristoyl] glucosamine N-acyltransferase